MSRVVVNSLGIHGHWRNENVVSVGSRDEERKVGSGFWRGRAWLTVGSPDLRYERAIGGKDQYKGWMERRGRVDRALFPLSLRWEWCLLKHAKFLHLDIETDDEDGLKVSVALRGLFALWFSVAMPWFLRMLWKSDHNGPEGRLRVLRDWTNIDILDISIHGGCVFYSFFHPSHSWSRGTPWWRHHVFHVGDWIFGKRDRSVEAVEEREVLVPMPERSYRATAKLELVTVKRRFSVDRWKATEIKMHEGEEVPIPGKGENSYDLDQDATYSTYSAHDTIEEAVGSFVGSTLQTRLRRGGRNWVPEVRGAQPSSS